MVLANDPDGITMQSMEGSSTNVLQVATLLFTVRLHSIVIVDDMERLAMLSSSPVAVHVPAAQGSGDNLLVCQAAKC